jgi:uncharacterized repeat protein (TIGR03803 family)
MKRSGSNWIFDLLYSFSGRGADGAIPKSRVIFGPDGGLYGTTEDGGIFNYGVVFEVKPPPTPCRGVLCPWSETVLYSFPGGRDGSSPESGLLFDSAGNIYGTTILGGSGQGVVYQLTHSGGTWSETPIHIFNGSDGYAPWAGVSADTAGNLYGTTFVGGAYNVGTVFQLSRSSGWAENLLHSFTTSGDTGSNPFGVGVILDHSGNLYGATTYGNVTGLGGGVFELSRSGRDWTFTVLDSLPGPVGNPCGPRADLVMDAAGNLYGTTYCDGAYEFGSVFKLSPSSGGWSYTDLHDFTGGSDGGNPISNVVVDSEGNLYGTTQVGGDDSVCGGDNSPPGCGVVWEITP